MNSPVTALRVAGTVFGLMAVAQLVRLLVQPQILVAGRELPLWPSIVALVFLGGLAVWMWRVARIR